MFNAQDYSHNLTPGIQIMRDAFQRHAKHLKWSTEPESILDLGIGDGRMTKEVIFSLIPTNLKEYVGCDLSQTMLDYAEKTISHEKFKSLLMDAATKNLPLEMTGRFDHIFSNWLFHHIQDTRQVLTNVWNMLKPGGQLFFNAFEELFTDEIFLILDQGKWKKYNNRQRISPFYGYENPVKEYETILKDIGFVNRHIFTQPINTEYSERSFTELAVSVNLNVWHVDEEDRTEYIKDFTQKIGKSSKIKIFNNEHENERIFQMNLDMITGIVTKPEE